MASTESLLRLLDTKILHLLTRIKMDYTLFIRMLIDSDLSG